MRQRPPREPALPDNRDLHTLPFGNGAEVYEKDTRRLKGYVVNHAPGKNRCEAFDARGVSLGEGGHSDCLLKLSEQRAVRVASEVFIESNPRKRKA